MDMLQALRSRLGKPLIIRSGYRSPSHNRAVGGAPASKHMRGTAFDIAMANHDPVAFAETARAVGYLGFSTYSQRIGCHPINQAKFREFSDGFKICGIGKELLFEESQGVCYSLCVTKKTGSDH